jgi:hypothetical protein
MPSYGDIILVTITTRLSGEILNGIEVQVAEKLPIYGKFGHALRDFVRGAKEIILSRAIPLRDVLENVCSF